MYLSPCADVVNGLLLKTKVLQKVVNPLHSIEVVPYHKLDSRPHPYFPIAVLPVGVGAVARGVVGGDDDRQRGSRAVAAVGGEGKEDGFERHVDRCQSEQ